MIYSINFDTDWNLEARTRSDDDVARGYDATMLRGYDATRLRGYDATANVALKRINPGAQYTVIQRLERNSDDSVSTAVGGFHLDWSFKTICPETKAFNEQQQCYVTPGHRHRDRTTGKTPPPPQLHPRGVTEQHHHKQQPDRRRTQRSRGV